MRRLAAVTVLTTGLTAALLGVPGAQPAMAAPLAGQGCILGLICFPWLPSVPSPSPSSSPSPSPDPSAASPTASQTAGTPSGAASPSGAVSPGDTQSPGAGSASAGSAGRGASASASPTASPATRSAAAVPGLTAAAATSVLTAGTAGISGFHYVGNVSVPVAGGTETMMKFTASSIDLSGGVTVTVTQNGTTVTTASDSQNFSGGVTLYAAKLSGSLTAGPGLPGIPLTFTPSTIAISVLKLPNVGELQLANLVTGAIPLTLTGVTTNQLLISSGSQVTTGLSMS